MVQVVIIKTSLDNIIFWTVCFQKRVNYLLFDYIYLLRDEVMNGLSLCDGEALLNAFNIVFYVFNLISRKFINHV